MMLYNIAMAYRKNAPENVEIVVFGLDLDNCQLSEEDEYLLEEAQDLFGEQGIRVSRVEGVYAVAVVAGSVVGAITFGSFPDDVGYMFTFSVVVDDAWKRKGIARDLVKLLLNDSAHDPRPHYFRVWVVNEHMVALLESLGFDTEGGEWSQDSPHMYKYN